MLTSSRGPSLSPPKRVTCPDISPPSPDPEIERFYLAYFLPLVRRAVRRHGLSVQDADDVVQDAFILAISKLDSAKNPKAWLYQVVDHLSANFQRKVVRRARLMAHWNPAGRSALRGSKDGSVDDQ